MFFFFNSKIGVFFPFICVSFRGGVQWQEGCGARSELQSWFSALWSLVLFHEPMVRRAAPRTGSGMKGFRAGELGALPAAGAPFSFPSSLLKHLENRPQTQSVSVTETGTPSLPSF